MKQDPPGWYDQLFWRRLPQHRYIALSPFPLWFLCISSFVHSIPRSNPWKFRESGDTRNSSTGNLLQELFAIVSLGAAIKLLANRTTLQLGPAPTLVPEEQRVDRVKWQGLADRVTHWRSWEVISWLVNADPMPFTQLNETLNCMLWRVKTINKKEGSSDNGIPVTLQICLTWEHITLQLWTRQIIFCSIYYQLPYITLIF